MGKRKWIYALGLACCVGTGVLLAGCSGSSSADKTVRLSYVEWDSETASTNVVAQVLKDMGYKVTTTPLDMQVMWQAVATGKSDGMVAAWLPTINAAQYEKYKNDMVDLGINLKGCRVGLVVPAYMPVNSIADLTTEANKHITGIEPGSGTMQRTYEVVQSYPNLKDWIVDDASSGAMVTALKKAIDTNSEIIVVGWSPHWKFAKYDLKYLDDPKGIYGGEGEIRTMVRKGLDKDNPGAYKILDQFHWDVEDMEAVMMDISDGMKPEEAAKKWVDAHPDKVAEWTKGVEKAK